MIWNWQWHLFFIHRRLERMIEQSLPTVSSINSTLFLSSSGLVVVFEKSRTWKKGSGDSFFNTNEKLDFCPTSQKSFLFGGTTFFCPTKNSEHNSLCHKTRKNSRRHSILNCVWLLLGNFLPKNITKVGNIKRDLPWFRAIKCLTHTCAQKYSHLCKLQ